MVAAMMPVDNLLPRLFDLLNIITHSSVRPKVGPETMQAIVFQEHNVRFYVCIIYWMQLILLP